MIKIEKNKTRCTDCIFISEAAKSLTVDQLRELTKESTDVTLKKGDKLFVEGFPHSHVIYIREGFVKVHKTGPSGRPQIIKFARPGSWLGIQCLFGSEVNEFTATALGKARLCYISGNTFKKLVQENAAFASRILSYICREELLYFENFVNLQQKNNSGKLADAILFFSEAVFGNNHFTLPLSYVDLAALNSTTRESISRQIKDLVRGGIIEVRNREIRILDKAMLRKISENG